MRSVTNEDELQEIIATGTCPLYLIQQSYGMVLISLHCLKIKKFANPANELLGIWSGCVKVTLRNSLSHRFPWFFLPGQPCMNICFHSLSLWKTPIRYSNLLHNTLCHRPQDISCWNQQAHKIF